MISPLLVTSATVYQYTSTGTYTNTPVPIPVYLYLCTCARRFSDGDLPAAGHLSYGEAQVLKVGHLVPVCVVPTCHLWQYMFTSLLFVNDS